MGSVDCNAEGTRREVGGGWRPSPIPQGPRPFPGIDISYFVFYCLIKESTMHNAHRGDMSVFVRELRVGDFSILCPPGRL